MAVIRNSLFIGGLVCILAACTWGEGERAMSKESATVVRKAWGGGRWFPGNRRQLESSVTEYIEAADAPKVKGRIVGAIAPHAGYIYSGKVAGYTFRAVRDNATTGQVPETVVVLGFSHRGGFPGVALMDGDAIETPIGQTALDKDAAAVLIAHSPRIRMNYAPHAGEHSAENEIPFVQVALPSAKLVVGLFGEHEPETLDAMVGALEDLAKKKAILAVASTDMLHDPDYDRVTRTDKATLEKIKTLDDKGLLGSWDYSEQVCCGIGPVVAVMRFAKAQGCRSGTILHYRNSGDDYPESRGSWVVGYGAVVFSVEKDK